jgi:hypothetical protein
VQSLDLTKTGWNVAAGGTFPPPPPPPIITYQPGLHNTQCQLCNGQPSGLPQSNKPATYLYVCALVLLPYIHVLTVYILPGPYEVTTEYRQSAGPVRFLIVCSISIFLLAILVAGRSARCKVAGNVLHHTYPLEYHICASQPRQKSCWASSLRI